MKTLTEAIRPTVLIEAEKLRKHLGIDLTVVTETFQHTGSFKFRAAYNLALNVPNEEILTASSGNFGQALAFACQLLNKKCTVVMPETSAQVKIEAVRSYGANVDLIDTKTVSRSERLKQLAEKMPGAYYASPYDDLLVIEGNATLGEELSVKNFDVILAPIGGGGLISGLAQSLDKNGNQPALVGAEPLLGNDAFRSFQAGKIISNEFEPMTVADGARTLSLGRLNWEIIRRSVAEIIEVSEENIREAVKLYFSLANLKVEPTGALSLGAILENLEKFKNKKVCVIVSGGNVDQAIYRQILNS